MSPDELWEKYLRYIGAGAVIFGGLISLIKSTPTIAVSMWSVVAGAFNRSRRSQERTDRDLPMPLLLLGLIGLAYVLYRFVMLRFVDEQTARWATLAVLVFGFFFVTVSSRLSGIVGNSSNPASGMTIATLLGTSILFVYGLGMTDDHAKFTCIAVGAVVCSAICIAGDCSQDLKTGFLVRATPWRQQIGEIIGVLAVVTAIAAVIVVVGDTYGYVKSVEHPNPVLAPQANIMKLLVEGVMDGSLPWVLIVVGMAAALVVELLGIPVLPVAVGLYLPLHISAAIMAGGLLRWITDKQRRSDQDAHNPGILGASGLVAGQGLVGIATVGVVVFIGWWWNDPTYVVPLGDGLAQRVIPEHFMPWLSEVLGMPQQYGYGDFGFNLFPLAPFMVLVLWLGFTAIKKQPPLPAIPVESVNPPPPPEEIENTQEDSQDTDDTTLPFELSGLDEVTEEELPQPPELPDEVAEDELSELLELPDEVTEDELPELPELPQDSEEPEDPEQPKDPLNPWA